LSEPQILLSLHKIAHMTWMITFLIQLNRTGLFVD